MQVFQNLLLHGPEPLLRKTCDLIAESLTDGWSRSDADEKRLHGMSTRPGEFWYCFTCSKAPPRTAATVFLTLKDSSTLYTSNILPIERGSLTYDQYNAVLMNFVEQLVRPAAEKTGIRVELTSDKTELEDWLSPDSAKKLRRFSAHANRTTGSSHTSDREVWVDFLISMYREHSEFNASLLLRWLQEVEGWPEDIAYDLVTEFEFAVDLLSAACPRS